MAAEIIPEDCEDDNMICTDHPYKNTTPGGICAFCLQEKLGKLVSSSTSFPITVFPSSSSSSSPPSFRSDHTTTTTTTTRTTRTTTTTSSIVPVRTLTSSGSGILSNTSIVPVRTHTSSGSGILSNTGSHYHHHYFKISKIPFLITHKKKKIKKVASTGSSDQIMNNNSMIFKRSKSTVTPRRGAKFNESNEVVDELTANKRSFWSFMYLSRHSSTKKPPEMKEICCTSTAGTGNLESFSRSRERKKEVVVVVEENQSPSPAPVSFDRKVSRSRSVGCGSRSFSGDFFERISTGFGDCTLRRVESQREGKSRVRRGGGGGAAVAGGSDSIKERVRCGGLFSGFMITSSSSSSSSSSNYVSSSTEDNNSNSNNFKPTVVTATATAAAATATSQLAHGRSKSWGWAFTSPMRAFSKPPSIKRSSTNKNGAPNLAAIPTLLTVRN